MADLCEALGFARSDTARLTRIANANVRHERGGAPYVMGDDLARKIEEKLMLERGWMDTPPGYEYAQSDDMRQLLHAAEQLETYQVAQLVEIATTLAKLRPIEQPLEATRQEKDAEYATASHRPAVVPGSVAKKIGKGYFGPPADRPDGDSSGSSTKNRERGGKGYARRG